MTKIAIVGLGHWGPNYLRNFSQMDGCQVVACADRDAARLETFRKNYPDTRFYQKLDDLYKKESPDATVIATPTSTHFAVATQALSNLQHVLIEKPLALTEKECVGLTDLAKKQKRILMVGHTFLYNSAVIWLKKFLNEGHAGKTYYLYAVRTNLGPVRQDVNAIVDLAPHDISIYMYLIGKRPKAVSAQGAGFLDPKREDVGFLTLYFDDNVLGHIQVSWLDPRKVRQTTVIGDKKMVLFDDINVFEPIRIYDKGFRKPREYFEFSEFKALLYDGDVVIPKVPMGEPLKNQCREFLSCVAERRKPLSDGEFATDVTRVLAAAAKSLKQKGKIVPL